MLLRKYIQEVSIQNIVDGIRITIKKITAILTKLWDKVVNGREDIEIPEEWLNPSVDVITEAIQSPTPVAVEPTIVFEEPKEYRFALSVPFIFGVKRILAFVLLIGCVVSIYWTVRSFPFGLLLTGPSSFIFLDYLMKTHPTETKLKWYVLQDLEEKK